MTIFEKYDSKIKDLSENGSGIIIYSFGEEEATNLILEAIERDCYLQIIYNEYDDGIEKIIFKKNK